MTCPDCDDRKVLIIAGEKMPCPACCPEEYVEACRERRLDPELAGRNDITPDLRKRRRSETEAREEFPSGRVLL